MHNKTNDYEAVFARIKGFGVDTQEKLAMALGIKQQTISVIKKRGKFPEKWAFKIAQKYHSSTDYLLTGEGSMVRGEVVRDADKNSVTVGVYALAGAGSPKELTEYEPIRRIDIPNDFFKASIVPVLISGRSMEPMIWDGAVVGVDRDDKKPVSGEVYAVWIPHEGAVVKRLFFEPDKIIVRSDNAAHPPFTVRHDESNDHFIMGRVRWVIQKI